MEKVVTPGVKTIADLMRFFDTGEANFLKTVAYEADGELVLAVIRGDYTISVTKLGNHMKALHIDLASEDRLASQGLHAGFLSPVGIKGIRMVMDTSVGEQDVFVAGANEIDMHYKNVRYGRDFEMGEKTDIAEVREGDLCAKCRHGSLRIGRGIELGHTFKLGTKYTATDTMDVTYLDPAGEQKRVIMGCYGIGVERLMASVVERWHDDSGMILPITIAPFQVVLVAIGKNPEVLDAAEKLYKLLSSRYEVLYDDRDESAGVKLKDADLLGFPIRVVVSQKLIKGNNVEVKVRRTGEVLIRPQADLEETLERIADSLQPSLEGLPYMAE
jgi:prolyl-tRNA synthetase